MVIFILEFLQKINFCQLIGIEDSFCFHAFAIRQMEYTVSELNVTVFTDKNRSIQSFLITLFTFVLYKHRLQTTQIKVVLSKISALNLTMQLT